MGHVHFAWYGDFKNLKSIFDKIKPIFYKETEKMTANMRARGGGILDIDIVNKTDLEPNYYQLVAKFETCEAMEIIS